MSIDATNEQQFESDIEAALLSLAGGYVKGTDTYSAQAGLYVDTLIDFIKRTQPKEWARFKRPIEPIKTFMHYQPNHKKRSLESCLVSGFTSVSELKLPIVSDSSPDMEPLRSRMETISVIFFGGCEFDMEQARELLEAGKPSEALERLKTILTTAREEWRVHELIGAAFHDLCDAEGSAQAYFNAARTDRYLRSQRAHFSNYIFALHYLTQLDAATLVNELAIYNSLYRDAEPLPESLRITHSSLRIAFLSPHFCDSSSARFYEALLTDYDREKFRVTAWSLSKEEDLFTKKIRRSVDGYFDIAETSFEEAAEQIRDSGADILIDLGGHTEGGTTLQIAVYKPARIQMTCIGYFDSTGLDAIDYFVGDEFLTVHDEIFTENVLRLKNAFAFRPNERMIRERKTRRPFPHKNFTFGSLNNFMKLSDDYLIAVKSILDAMPDAKIIFRDTTPLKSRQDALIERLNSLEIKNFEVRRGSDNYFTDYSEIDLMLDTFPYTGGMMTALALYMGVPVLNLCGELPHTRTGADILRIADVEEMIVYDIDAYISKAVELAQNRAKLSTLTGKISVDKMTDTKTFVEDFYRSLEAMI